jgi:hypothetical protein
MIMMLLWVQVGNGFIGHWFLLVKTVYILSQSFTINLMAPLALFLGTLLSCHRLSPLLQWLVRYFLVNRCWPAQGQALLVPSPCHISQLTWHYLQGSTVLSSTLTVVGMFVARAMYLLWHCLVTVHICDISAIPVFWNF